MWFGACLLGGVVFRFPPLKKTFDGELIIRYIGLDLSCLLMFPHNVALFMVHITCEGLGITT